MELFFWNIGDTAIFDNGKTPPENIVVEDVVKEWDKGRQIKMVVYRGTKYAVKYLKKPTEIETKTPPDIARIRG